MGSKTGIEWADATVNFWQGCTKVSAGCKACYMYRDMARWNKDGSVVSKVSLKTINKTLRDLGDKPARIFTCSYSDFFIEEADEWRDEAWAIIKAYPQHTWMILTKRPERMQDCLPADWGRGYDNVWLGISAENQETYEDRSYYLTNTPAKLRFLSLEPLLGPIDLGLEHEYQDMDGNELGMFGYEFIHWVIVGGESGYTTGKYAARATKYQWITEIVAECTFSKVPVFVKQLGTVLAKELGLKGNGDPNELPQIKYNKLPQELPKL